MIDKGLWIVKQRAVARDAHDLDLPARQRRRAASEQEGRPILDLVRRHLLDRFYIPDNCRSIVAQCSALVQSMDSRVLSLGTRWVRAGARADMPVSDFPPRERTKEPSHGIDPGLRLVSSVPCAGNPDLWRVAHGWRFTGSCIGRASRPRWGGNTVAGTSVSGKAELAAASLRRQGRCGVHGAHSGGTAPSACRADCLADFFLDTRQLRPIAMAACLAIGRARLSQWC